MLDRYRRDGVADGSGGDDSVRQEEYEEDAGTDEEDAEVSLFRPAPGDGLVEDDTGARKSNRYVHLGFRLVVAVI